MIIVIKLFINRFSCSLKNQLKIVFLFCFPRTSFDCVNLFKNKKWNDQIYSNSFPLFIIPRKISIIYVLSLLYIWIKDLLFHKIVEFFIVVMKTVFIQMELF